MSTPSAVLATAAAMRTLRDAAAVAILYSVEKGAWMAGEAIQT
jgi:hypothetical protein